MRKIWIVLLLVLIFMVGYSPLMAQEELGELAQLNQVEMLARDGQDLYVLDGVQVHLYRLPLLKWQWSIGTQGKGPGEFSVDFMNRLRMHISPREIVLSDFNKVAFYSRNGLFLRELRLPFSASQVLPLKNGLLITRLVNGENGLNQMAVVLLDDQLKEKKVLYRKPEISVERLRRLNAPNEMIFLMADEENIYVSDQSKFVILVFTHLGEEVRKISVQSTPLPVTDQYRSEVYSWFDENWEGRFKSYAQSRGLNKDLMRSMIYFENVFPAFRSVTLTDQGFCFESYEKRDKQSKFLLVDKNGQMKRAFYLSDAEPGRVKMVAGVSYSLGEGQYLYAVEDAMGEQWLLMRERY